MALSALLDSPEALVRWLDLFGVAVFAASGALTASRKQMDIIGFIVVGAVTGIGGGSIRDLLLGRAPVFWIGDPLYLALCLGAALIVFFAAPFLESRFRALLWADAIGLAAFSVIGTQTALDAGAPGTVAILMGVITATFGGLIRDVLSGEVPLILRREIYATAAAAGATAVVILQAAAVSELVSSAVGFALAFAIRALGIVFHLSLPPYRSRPGRRHDDGNDDSS